MRKQITAIMSMVVIGAFLTSGSFAYFSATETSSGNLFSTVASGIDFQMGSDTVAYAHNPSPLIMVTNLLPGQQTGVYHVYYWNLPDSLTATVLINTAYTYYWSGQTVTADQFARHLWITQGSLDGSGPGVEYYWALQIANQAYGGSWAAALADNGVAVYNGNYVPTFYGMQFITLHFSNTYMGADWHWAPGETHTTGLNFMLDPSVGNEYINSGIYVTFTASITQV